MTDMLRMTAVKFRDPLVLVVFVKADDEALHAVIFPGRG